MVTGYVNVAIHLAAAVGAAGFAPTAWGSTANADYPIKLASASFFFGSRSRLGGLRLGRGSLRSPSSLSASI